MIDRTSALLALPAELWTDIVCPSMAPVDLVRLSMVCAQAHRLAHASFVPAEPIKIGRNRLDQVRHVRLAWPNLAICTEFLSMGNVSEIAELIAQPAPALALQGGIRELQLFHCNVYGLAAKGPDGLRGLHRLEMWSCCGLLDLAVFNRIHTLKFMCSPTGVDFSPLGRGSVQSLAIHFQWDLANVSPFQSIPHLSISNCPSVTNVRDLGSVRWLRLSSNNALTDVSALGKVHTLVLDGCVTLTDVSALGNVHTLSLRYCRKITDVSALGTVRRLDLSACGGITDVSALGNLDMLVLDRCHSLRDLSAVQRVPKLKLNMNESLRVY